MLILFVGTTAHAVDPPAVDPPPPPAPAEEDRLAAIEAELAALKDELEQARQEQLLSDAAALAAQSPPAPPPPPTSASAFNPAITAFGDLLGTLGARNGEVLPASKPWIRSLELDLRADVDPFAKAVAVFAVEQEPPVFVTEGAPAFDEPEFAVAPEELYVDFVAFPAGLSLRAGGFREPFGITNRAHPHDYPWPDTPLPLVELLGEEGLNDVGLLGSWHVPNPWGKGISLEGGVNSGARFDPDDETAVPAWIGRAEYFDRLGGLEIGLGGSATGLADQQVLGGDLLLRWHRNSWRSVVILAELVSDLDALGGYTALQIQPARPLYLGGRFDWLDERWQAGGYLTFYTSEFLRLRAGARTDADALLTVDSQLTFVFGSHPVEPYWVNR